MAQLRDQPAFDFVMPQPAKLPGRADDHLQIPFSRHNFTAIEDPLAEAVHQDDVRQFGGSPVEPGMKTCDRRRFQVSQITEIRLLGDYLGGQ